MGLRRLCSGFVGWRCGGGVCRSCRVAFAGSLALVRPELGGMWVEGCGGEE